MSFSPSLHARETHRTMAPATQPATVLDEPAQATILVVEDEEPVRNLAVRVLERRGYTVMAAADGQEALDLAADHPGEIDLILSDLVMPRVGGRELTRRIRLARPSTRILLMSGYDDQMVAGSLETDDFLPKPFTPAALTERVARLLAGSRA
jgi:two-component system, cell cycle sensor histidine kinase and response regulator CckA